MIMEDMELVCFKIISAVGEAKSDYVAAINAAREGDIAKAEELLAHGESVFVKGHEAHAGLIQKEAAGEKTEISLLLMHAEDQLMSAETTKLLAQEIIELRKNK